LKFYLLYYVGPFITAVALGFVLALAARRRSIAAPSSGARTLTAIGSVVAFLFMIAPFVAEIPFHDPPIPGLIELLWWFRDAPIKYSLPLIAGTIAIGLMTFAPSPKGQVSGAHL